ncbi:hypothetical protein BH18ACT14_BH18ACT14_10390 [soil metagenome]
MVVDRLEVDLPCEHEVLVLEAADLFERALDHEPDRVLDEAGGQMCMLDHEELIRALQELVDGRAHRPLDEAHQLLRVEPEAGAQIQEAFATLVVRRERDELEDSLDLDVVEARLA